MDSRKERIGERAREIRNEEGASHGRNPETMDPEMLDGEDAEVVRANKAISRGGADQDDHPLPFHPEKGERLPPD